MQKVLSTKLELDELERFISMAEQQGESKSKLLKHLVLDYLDIGSKADRVASTDVPNPDNSLNKALLIYDEGLNGEYLPSVYQPPSETQKCTSVADNSLLKYEEVDRPLNPAPLSEIKQPIYYNTELGRSTTSPKQSSGIGWVLVGLLGLCLWFRSATTTDCKSAFITQQPQVDESGLYKFKVGDTFVYSSSPIPFWQIY